MAYRRYPEPTTEEESSKNKWKAGTIERYRGYEVHVDDEMAEGNIKRWKDHVDQFLEEIPAGYDVIRFDAHSGRHYVGVEIEHGLHGVSPGIHFSKFGGFHPVRVRSTDSRKTVHVLFDPNGPIEEINHE